MTNAIAARSEIAAEHTWDASSVFASEADWEDAIGNINEQLKGVDRFRGHLGDSPVMLADWFSTVEKLRVLTGHIALYAQMFHHPDTGNAIAKARFDRAMGLRGKVSAAIAFAEPEMLALGFDKLRQWTTEEPRLAIYGQYFDELERLQAHVRSAEVEELLGGLLDPFMSATATHGILADADLRFTPARNSAGEEFEIGQGNIGALLSDPDRELRRSAWENYSDAHLAFKNTMANVVATGTKQRVFLARARGYSTALEAALTPNHLPVAVFDNLISTFKRHLPTWHRYWRIRREALGYDKLHVYDIKAPLTSKSPEVPYAQSIEWISAGMKPLGDEYVDVMRRGLLEQRWVDIYPNRGKRAGAYSTGYPGTHPFILMSYNDDIFSMSTLAHELGHSMHKHYTTKTQPLAYAGYTIFMAEIASNFNQALVRAHLLDSNSDPDFQIAVIEEAMSNFHRYFFIMPTLARLELEMHTRVERGQGLTAETLNGLTSDFFAEGYGEEVEIDADRTGITWAEFPTHMYLNYYVFQYATGISGAHALAEGVLAGKPGAAEKYLEFLGSGNSLYPLDTLKRAGVDMTSPEPVESTFAVLGGLVDRLEKLVHSKA